MKRKKYQTFENRNKKNKQTNKQQDNKEKQQQHIIAPVYITGRYAIRQLL